MKGVWRENELLDLRHGGFEKCLARKYNTGCPAWCVSSTLVRGGLHQTPLLRHLISSASSSLCDTESSKGVCRETPVRHGGLGRCPKI